MQRFARMLGFTGAAVLVVLFCARVQAQSWDIDLDNSTIAANINTVVVNDAVPPFFQDDFIDMDQLNPNFVAPAGTFDYGNGIDQATQIGFVVASGAAFVTVDGVGGDTINVRWSTDALNDSELTPGEYLSTSNVNVASIVRFDLNDLTPGQPYALVIDYFYEGVAITEHEDPPAFEDPEQSQGSLNVAFGGDIYPLFDQTVNSDLPGNTGEVDDFGQFVLPFIATATSMQLTAGLNSYSQATLAPPTSDDLSGAFFFSEAVIRIVPEPTTALLLALGGAALLRRRAA